MLLHIRRADRRFERGCPVHELVLSESLQCPAGHACSEPGEDERLSDNTTLRWLVLEVVNGAPRRVAGKVYWHRVTWEPWFQDERLTLSLLLAGRDHEGLTRLLLGQAALNAAKQQCPHGHPYDEANTMWKRRPSSGRLKRLCRVCENEHQRRWRATHRPRLAAEPLPA